MNSNIVQLPESKTRTCPNCETANAHAMYERQEFAYGEGPTEVTLSALVPVWKCDECGFEFTDGAGEELRHEAICHHLGLLSPREIRAVRQSNGLTIDEFSNLTGIGPASIKRWENGRLIQNRSHDRLLRLLTHSTNISRLRRLNGEADKSPDENGGTATAPYRFRTPISDSARMRGRKFQLRRVAG